MTFREMKYTTLPTLMAFISTISSGIVGRVYCSFLNPGNGTCFTRDQSVESRLIAVLFMQRQESLPFPK